MKKSILFLFLFSFFLSFSQKEVAKKVQSLVATNTNFRHFSVLQEDNSLATNDTKKVVETATFGKIKNANINDIVSNRYENLEIEIPYKNQLIEVQLYKVDIYSEGFHIDTDKQKNVPYQQGVFYRGIVKNDFNSVVSFSFFQNEFNAIISNSALGNLVVAKLDKQNNLTDYIVYSDAEMKIQNSFECATRDSSTSVSSTASPTSTRCVTMYFEIDNDLYSQNGNSTTQTGNWLSSVFNNIQTLYSNDGITVALKSSFIWTTQDPYDGIGSSSSDYLFKFNEVRPVFDGDVGQLLGIDSGGLGGVAIGINGLCTQDNFSYSDVNFSYSTVPTFSWTIEVITHEFGHLLGSPHTHGCHWNGNETAIDGCGSSVGYVEGSCDEGPIPTGSVKGTIMSYCHLVSGVGINFNNGFGPQPAARILNAVNNGACLSTDCVNTCINTVASIDITNTTATTTTFTWTDLSASNTSWQVALVPFGGGTAVWTTVNTNSYTANGLTANTFYRVKVRNVCGAGLEASERQYVVLTPALYCNGITLTDTGGINDNYTDSETYVRTIIPNLTNKKIKLTFSFFSLEADYDYLYLYDGNSVSAPDLSSGGFTGNTNPGSFTSTAVDGSLTLKFYSDGGVVEAGYVADVICENLLGTNNFDQNIDFTYFPNPTNGKVNMSSNTLINSVKVYNITGQLLYENTVNAFSPSIDITQYASGTYFFKVNVGEKEVNFKIQKQ